MLDFQIKHPALFFIKKTYLCPYVYFNTTFQFTIHIIFLFQLRNLFVWLILIHLQVRAIL
jgi:hypothetical protein